MHLKQFVNIVLCVNIHFCSLDILILLSFSAEEQENELILKDVYLIISNLLTQQHLVAHHQL